MKRTFAILFILVGLSLQISAQSFERAYLKNVEESREQAAGSVNLSIPYDLLRAQRDVTRALQVIDQTLSDTLMPIRKLGYQSLDVLHGVATETLEHQQIAGVQFKGLDDASAEIRTITLDNLSELDPQYYTTPQRQALTNRLGQQSGNVEVLLEVVGKLQEPAAIESIRPYAQAGNSPTVRWKAYLAMARLGDQAAVATILGKMENLEVNTDVVYDIVPGIIYTQQKALYDWLVNELNSEQRNCLPADPDQTRPINCAYRILEYIAPQIAEFPLAVSESGDLETRNYRQALQTARDWFDANPDYEISTNQ
ncbi:hypothetical protein [Marinoscillum sp.]|uniref:hypothetical protein n=1 Tax=Marinoscillum sp. TaxID=2024838 RepID=UPI003BAB9BB0